MCNHIVCLYHVVLCIICRVLLATTLHNSSIIPSVNCVIQNYISCVIIYCYKLFFHILSNYIQTHVDGTNNNRICRFSIVRKDRKKYKESYFQWKVRNNSQLFLKERLISSAIVWLWLIGQPDCLLDMWGEKGCISRWLDGPHSPCMAPFLFPATALAWYLWPRRGRSLSSSLSVSSSAKLGPLREHIEIEWYLF